MTSERTPKQVMQHAEHRPTSASLGTACEWPMAQLGAVTDVTTGFPFQSQIYTFEKTAPRLLRGDNIVQGTLRWDGVKRWPSNKVDGLDQYWLKEGDVVLAMDRPWIEAGLKYASINDADVPSLLVQRVARLRGTTNLDCGYLKFVIASQAFTDHVLAVQTGTAVPHISAGQIRQFTFQLPPIEEQCAIAHILGTLDDKIELNRKMNETLEAMARALFKSWFVDFDPVRAKAEGRLPAGRQATPASPKPGSWCVYALECEDGSIYIGHTQNLDRRYEEHAGGKGAEWTKRHPPLRIAYWEGLPSQAAAVAREKTLKTGSGREWLKAEIAHQGLATGGLPAHLAALFPDSFEDTELGEIPFGWTVLCLDETARFLNGLALQKFPPKGDRFLPVIKISQLRVGDTTGADKASADLAAEYVVDDGDVLFSWSGSLECVLWAGGRGALNQHLFKVTSEKFPKWFYFLWIHWHLEDFRHIAAGKATTMGHIQRHHLTDAKLLVPPPELLQAMSGFMQPIIESIWRRKVQSRTLAAFRDMLLPKLISGELRVPEAAGLT